MRRVILAAIITALCYTAASAQTGEVTEFVMDTVRARGFRPTPVAVEDVVAYLKAALEVEIPELVQVRPLFLLWRRGDPAATKMVTVRVMEPAAGGVRASRFRAMGGFVTTPVCCMPKP